MRGSRNEIPATAAAFEIIPEDDSRALDLEAIFGRVAPLEVDLGCGDGAFLSELAAQNRDRDFLGVERMLGRIHGACKRFARLELTNARILSVDIAQAVQQLLAPGSVEVFYLLFSDPWPKRRHHDRRVFTPELLGSIARALALDGRFCIATDDTAYFEAMMQIVHRNELFALANEAFGSDLPGTTFEKRFVESGLEIHRFVLRKVSAPR
jgi:tRNA (guanine-N7-)-methyltransferase